MTDGAIARCPFCVEPIGDGSYDNYAYTTSRFILHFSQCAKLPEDLVDEMKRELAERLFDVAASKYI